MRLATPAAGVMAPVTHYVAHEEGGLHHDRHGCTCKGVMYDPNTSAGHIYEANQPDRSLEITDCREARADSCKYIKGPFIGKCEASQNKKQVEVHEPSVGGEDRRDDSHSHNNVKRSRANAVEKQEVERVQ